MTSIKRYRVVNEPLVRQIALQFDLPIDVEVSEEGELGANLRLLNGKRKRSTKTAARSADDPRIVESVVAALRDNGLLSGFRPESASYYATRAHTGWVFEDDLLATPVTVPVSPRFADAGAPEAMTVWVSDPLPVQGKYEPFEFVGSFLFLVEELTGSAERRGFLVPSGASALKTLLNHVAGLEAETRWHDRQRSERVHGGDSFGRDDPAHPIEKLQRVGGVVGRPRMIESAYRIAYLTDEQAYTVQGEEVRVNDIVAYPLYIAEL